MIPCDPFLEQAPFLRNPRHTCGALGAPPASRVDHEHKAAKPEDAISDLKQLTMAHIGQSFSLKGNQGGLAYLVLEDSGAPELLLKG